MADEDDSPIPEERFTPDPDEQDGNGEDGPGEVSPLVINGQYIKDFSFEAPHTPEIYSQMQEEMPEIRVDIDVSAGPKGENIFEVVLKCRAEARVKDQLAYLVEIEYGGLFTINVDAETLGPVLLIECPLILFPFLRRIISDVTGDGGFAPLMLTPIDFAALYQQRVIEAQQQQQESGEDFANDDDGGKED
ncbi:MAG: protein-export chaperone SecB [Rhodospirillales bacterium]|nr:protein-export chaperone SecB [Rhodospirillales bacterium]